MLVLWEIVINGDWEIAGILSQIRVHCNIVPLFEDISIKSVIELTLKDP